MSLHRTINGGVCVLSFFDYYFTSFTTTIGVDFLADRQELLRSCCSTLVLVLFGLELGGYFFVLVFMFFH